MLLLVWSYEEFLYIYPYHCVVEPKFTCYSCYPRLVGLANKAVVLN